MAQKIQVQNATPRQPDGGMKVAIFERNPAHEGGELFIGDDKVHTVVATPEVRMALNDGRLKLAGDDEEMSGAPDSDRYEELMKLSKDELLAEAEAADVEVSSSATKAEIAQAIIAAE